MSRPGPRTVLWLILSITLGGLSSACARRIERPNIVLILADDLAWNQLACYGSSFYETPHLDDLARQGMRFTDAYAASPICSPTRASIMTGKYPARLRVTQFISPGDYAGDAIKLLEPDWTRRLPLEEETIAEALKDMGYVTAAFGKWHLSQAKTPPGSLPFNPDKQGFDEDFVTYKPVPRMAREWQTPENDAHNVRIITEKSLEFMEKNRERPFFLFVSHNSVHTPLVEKEALISKYRRKPDVDAPTNHPAIGAMIETLDLSVGRLLAKLDEMDISERTLVLFISDNGGLEWSGDDGPVPANHPLRAGKGDLYEGGIRVPLIARWPTVIDPRQRSRGARQQRRSLPYPGASRRRSREARQNRRREPAAAPAWGRLTGPGRPLLALPPLPRLRRPALERHSEGALQAAGVARGEDLRAGESVPALRPDTRPGRIYRSGIQQARKDPGAGHRSGELEKFRGSPDAGA